MGEILNEGTGGLNGSSGMDMGMGYGNLGVYSTEIEYIALHVQEAAFHKTVLPWTKQVEILRQYWEVH